MPCEEGDRGRGEEGEEGEEGESELMNGWVGEWVSDIRTLHVFVSHC